MNQDAALLIMGSVCGGFLAGMFAGVLYGASGAMLYTIRRVEKMLDEALEKEKRKAAGHED